MFALLKISAGSVTHLATVADRQAAGLWLRQSAHKLDRDIVIMNLTTLETYGYGLGAPAFWADFRTKMEIRLYGKMTKKEAAEFAKDQAELIAIGEAKYRTAVA